MMIMMISSSNSGLRKQNTNRTLMNHKHTHTHPSSYLLLISCCLAVQVVVCADPAAAAVASCSHLPFIIATHLSRSRFPSLPLSLSLYRSLARSLYLYRGASSLRSSTVSKSSSSLRTLFMRGQKHKAYT